MKKILILSSFILISILIIPSFFIDKESIKNFIQAKVEKDLNHNLTFDESIKVSLFPKPSLEIKNVKVSNKDNPPIYLTSSKRIKIYTDWKSLFRKKPKIDSIEIVEPKILIPKRINSALSKVNLFHNINFNDENFIQKYFKYFKKLKVVNGELMIFQSKKDHLLFKKINLDVVNNDSTSLKGEFQSDEFNSNLRFKLNTKDFKIFIYEMNHNFLLFKDINILKGKMLVDKKDINIDGEVFVKNLNIKELNNNLSKLKKFTINKNDEKLIYVNKNKKYNLKIQIDFLLENIRFENHLFKSTKFLFLLNNLQSNIKNGTTSYLNSKIQFFFDYFIDERKIKGLISGDNFIIPDWFFGKTKFDLVGGNTDFKIFLKNNKEIRSFNDLEKNIIINANIECIAPSILGIDVKEIIDRYKEIKSFSNILEIFKYDVNSGITKVESIDSKFKFESGYIYLEKFFVKNNDIDVSAEGKIDISNSKLNINHNIEFNSIDLPDFQIIMTGDINKPKLKYNLDELKKKIVNKALNNIIKNNNNKIIVEPNKLFELFNNENLNSKKLLEKLF